jgi:methylated-DNA-[protein]-cysteine S-methyltransferase
MANPDDIRAGRLVPGMTFQEKVWVMTARIPLGQVTTYGEIARALGTRAYRAVGQALHRNPYATEVPCHRVIGSDGSLTGYGGGLRKKILLLRSEGVQVRKGKVIVEDFFRFDASGWSTAHMAYMP